MKNLVWLFRWVLKFALFFTLFAFALNNQQDVTVHFFFGTYWRAPQVLVILGTFAIGVAVGALGMVPRWLKQRRAAIAKAEAALQSEGVQLANARPQHEL
jgi:uncharacterized integral membrane protein